MTRRNVTDAGKRASKPAKPRKDFPLFAHSAGQWAKKVRGKLHYFGVWADPVAAEKEWERTKLALLEGRDPDVELAGVSVGWLCNVFMDSKKLKHEQGELAKGTVDEYHGMVKAVAAFFGKGRRLDSLRPGDFERYRNSLPSTWSPTTTNNHLRLVRVLFKYANDIEATERDIRYKLGLKAVGKPLVRKHQAKQHAKEFTVEEVWALFNAATQPMRSFILLGLNAAYGTADIGRLRIDQIDFANNWLGEPRGKTGIARGCWLWPETVAELRVAIEQKPFTTLERLEPLAFLTKRRQPWSVDGSTSRPLTQAFGKLKEAAKINKTHVGHYSLRHTFATVASGARDPEAVDFVMGHKDASMRANYREGIDQERVKAVCQHVRQWFLEGKPKAKKGGAK
ncbi:tyrosine-type recombinase/integrase [Rhodopirellula bahusiensis]|uniref:tyrosine-type recombinase/integrase n=1 Tax=Rhodopirellula bahusiensis TaxID=2014065 RepID=UPI00326731C2